MAGMHRNGLETVSLWQETTPTLPADRKAREECDVCIIGAGIAGLTAAYLLRREGHDVQVVDAYDIGAGESGRTTAHLTAVLDDRFVTLEKLFGIDGAIERVDGVLFASDAEEVELLHREGGAALNAGFTEIVPVDTLSIPGVR